jgi:nucleoside-diphosphate-sugar epimerase
VKILITGNLGYVGPGVARELRRTRPDAWIAGVDPGYFAHCLTGVDASPEHLLHAQYFMDLRDLPDHVIDGTDVIINLAAISNDPIGNRFEDVTMEINHRAAVSLATRAKRLGVGRFVYASSCSIYGAADDAPRTEASTLGPLTAYARSKAAAETDLADLADDEFTVTSLRFATACGMSDRLRLDLVLNDFVAGALTSGKIDILSDGTPWRPLIHVRDMARAIDWAIDRAPDNGGHALSINVGSDIWNYQVRELADAVARILPGTEVAVNPDAPPDKRSYRVSFSQFAERAPNHQPLVGLDDAVSDLVDGLQRMAFGDSAFRTSQLMRLVALESLREKGLLTDRLEWTTKPK